MLVEFNNLLTLRNIAKLIGVSHQRMMQLHQQRKMPEPIGKIGNSCVWDRATILQWERERRPSKHEAEPEELPEPRIISNKIKCKFCGDIIESKHRHDFETCKCGRVSVDGGHDYLRRCYQEEGDYEELSETEK